MLRGVTRALLRDSALLDRILNCGDVGQLADVVQGHSDNVSKVDFVAAVNQCGMLGDRGVMEEVVGKWGLGVFDDPIYKSLLRGYVQCGMMVEARECWGCVEEVDGGDYGAGMMAAAGLGDVEMGDEIWKAAHSTVDLYTGELDSIEQFIMHYLACNIRGKSPRKKIDKIFAHAASKNITLTPTSFTTLLLSSPSPPLLRYVWSAFPAYHQTPHYSTYACQLLQTGDPSTVLTLTPSTRDLPFNTSYVESALTLMYSNQSITHYLPAVRTALDDAKRQGAEPRWVEVAEEKLRGL